MNRPMQRQLIRFYLTFKESNPTMLGLFPFNLRGYLLLLSIAVPLIVIEWWITGWMAGALLISFLLGAFFRDIGLHRRTCRAWPIVRELLDWTKISAKEAELRSIAPTSTSEPGQR
jgi:hypothetical protein